MAADIFNVRDEGFTVLAEGKDPITDIIFVHGVQGHPKKTWQYGSAPVPKPKTRNPFKSKIKQIAGQGQPQIGTASSVYWPKDLLAQDFENARVLTYGYDSHVSRFFKGAANQSGIVAHGEALLNAVERQRRDDPARPIIFIVHSLGGLILKQALSLSKNAMEEDQDLGNIYKTTFGIVFFGTPHRGSSYAQLGIWAKDIAVAAGFDANDKILRSLKPDDEIAGLLSKDFARMLSERAFKVFSFQEGQGFKGTYFMSRKIVDDVSSCLYDPWERKDFISANHMAMCRFQDEDDDGYRKVKGVLSKYLLEIQNKKVLEQERLAKEQQRLLDECLKSLVTAGMYQRLYQIDIAHPHTFEWIFTDPNAGFDKWLRGTEGLFWIKGKPGSGKSTLMKYVLENVRTREALSSRSELPLLAIPGFFFYDRGHLESQKSFQGLLRSILHQILSDIPALITVVKDTFHRTRDLEGRYVWTDADLERALAQILEQKEIRGCICLFIDALDEYNGNHTGVTRFLKNLVNTYPGQELRIRVCASSRPWNVFQSMLEDLPGLSIHHWTKDDIALFVTSRLEESKRDDSSELFRSITTRAEGVFLWVRLVTDELLQDLINGEPMKDILSKLSELPGDLMDFYRVMLQRIPPDKKETALCMLQLVLASSWPRLELGDFSLIVDLPEEEDLTLDAPGLAPLDDVQRCKIMERRIKTTCGGLLEIQRSTDDPWDSRHNSPSHRATPMKESDFKLTNSTVQFLHQTAKEFVALPENSDVLGGNSAKKNSIIGHQRIMKYCAYLMRRNDPENLCHPHWWWISHDEPITLTTIEYFLVNARASGFLSIQENAAVQEQNAAAIDKFFSSVRAAKGPYWMAGFHANTRARAAPGQNPPPVDNLSFSILTGLYQYSRTSFTGRGYLRPRDRPPLLYWVLLSCVWLYEVLSYGWDNEEHQSCSFAKFLLANGEDPNSVFTASTRADFGYLFTASEQSGKDDLGFSPPAKILERDQEDASLKTNNDSEVDLRRTSGMVATSPSESPSRIQEEAEPKSATEITVMHYALGLACRNSKLSSGRVPLLDLLCILIEGGGNTRERNYENHWGSRPGEAKKRSAIHYLLYQTPGAVNTFKDSKVSTSLCEVIKAFLIHGADPNALDSDGKSILECALPYAPYDLIEFMLEKGAKITPSLLSPSGEPSQDGNGILEEERWRRIECYTPEAREIARKYNPHWENLKVEDEVEESLTANVQGMTLGAKLRGWVLW